MASKAAKRGLSFEEKVVNAIRSRNPLGNAIIDAIIRDSKTKGIPISSCESADRIGGNEKPDIIVHCEPGRNVYLSLKSFSANYNQIDRNWVSYYVKLWKKLGCSAYINSNVEKALYLFVGQVDERGNPCSIKKLKEEAERLGRRPGELGRERRVSIEELRQLNLYDDLLNFFNNCKNVIIKHALIDDYDDYSFYFLVIKINERDKMIEYYIVHAKDVMDKLAQNGVVARNTTIYLGKVVIQRKGGNRHSQWDDSVANQLQFKIRPSDIIEGLSPIYVEYQDEELLW